MVGKQPLLLYLLFHPASVKARALAIRIHQELNEDALVPGLRIPTIFTPHTGTNRPVPQPRFDLAQRNFVAVLAENEMVVDEAWCTFVADTLAQCSGPGSRCVPFQLTEDAWPLDDRLRPVSFSRAFGFVDAEQQARFVVRRTVVELCRFLQNLDAGDATSKAPVKLFLSHAKADLGVDPRVVAKLIDALKEDQPVGAWVDSGDIPSGSKFAEEISRGVQETSLLVALTDQYATREWCREEVLLAKEYQRPIAIVDALSQYEARSFPYLGNVPRIRWTGDAQAGIDLLLKETLRTLHSVTTLARVAEPGDILFSRPPEFATLAGLPPGTSVLYPDPPLGNGESTRLAKMQVKVTTPLQRFAQNRSIVGRRIALSLSESTDIKRFGLDKVHLDATMIETSRYLLLKGATLAYGGYIGGEGYTQKLFELVQTYRNSSQTPTIHPIVNFRYWPLEPLSADELAPYKQSMVVEPVARPTDIDDSLEAQFRKAPSQSAEVSGLNRFVVARGLTEMRAHQADVNRSGVVARIVMGGKFGPTTVVHNGQQETRWYTGRVPGVLEEVILSLQTGQPVFLLGAFGGAARLVLDLLRGSDREEATWDYQKGAPNAIEMRQLYEQRGLTWLDYPAITEMLRSRGLAGLNPLLTPSEHEQLADSVDPLEIAEIILTGLNKMKC
jgi:hypothetical protein